MQHLGRDQYNHSFLSCLIQVSLATGIQQLPGQLRRLEAAAGIAAT